MAKRILVPLDVSPLAESIVPMVADAARGAGATVRLLHVAPLPQALVSETGQVIAYLDQEMERLEAEGMDYLRAVEVQLEGIPVECVVRFGDPVQEILLESEAFGADVIAVATAGRSGGEQVFRKSRLPVVLYHPGLWGSVGGAPQNAAVRVRVPEVQEGLHAAAADQRARDGQDPVFRLRERRRRGGHADVRRANREEKLGDSDAGDGSDQGAACGHRARKGGAVRLGRRRRGDGRFQPRKGDALRGQGLGSLRGRDQAQGRDRGVLRLREPWTSARG